MTIAPEAAMPDPAPSQTHEHILQFFAYEQLPKHLQAVSLPFAVLAHRLMELPRNPERTAALRKLLEAKDCAVRAALATDKPTPELMIGQAHGPRMAQPDDHAGAL